MAEEGDATRELAPAAVDVEGLMSRLIKTRDRHERELTHSEGIERETGAPGCSLGGSMDLCASAGIMTEIELRPVTELNRIFELLDGANESGKRFVIDIAGTLACNVSTAPVPRLNPSPLPSSLLREIAEAIWERLSNLINLERREETGLQKHVSVLGPMPRDAGHAG